VHDSIESGARSRRPCGNPRNHDLSASTNEKEGKGLVHGSPARLVNVHSPEDLGHGARHAGGYLMGVMSLPPQLHCPGFADVPGRV
jgi:hypothetical protein